MIMFGREYKKQFSNLEDRISEQRDEINSLKLELEAYRDHGVYIGKRYQHKDGGDTFEMNTFMYKSFLFNGTSFDDYVRVTYQPVHKKINSDLTTSIKLDTTDAEEEIDRLNKELVQFKSVPESVLKLLHKTLDEMSGGHTM
ncbi:RagB/SusD family nutrient uptake outer membrane protein [Weissella paramesenteroides]|uniref:hypothetical protein n=1 Tax=Weissella paramesenteroides TaxID=1249 RepID=UPI002402C28C|nr:hypothetical protein [Weissella paramesenteroides]MDF8366182.1 RagB/SusD family nutrient uptake outer membrane protein [Weissella paramesenteroides]